MRTLLAVFSLFMVAPAWSSTCDVGFAVTFFNGVANTLQDADSAKFATRDAIQETAGTVFDVYDSQPISYDVAYNTTQGTAQDVFETFVQRANQIDPSGKFENNFGYLYWTFLANTSQNYPGTISSALPTSLSAVASAIASWPQASVGIIAANLANQLNTAPTTSDVALQQATLTADANNGRLQLLVAHSQGNLFVDSANVFLSQSGLVTQGQYSTVHVAPATSILYGPYLLSSKDLVINGLGLLVGGIRPPNIFLPFSLTDPQGHGYQEIYLDAGLTDTQSGLSARALLEGLFRDALKSLDNQQCQLQVSAATTTVSPGDSVALSATLTPALSPTLDTNHITIKYKWTISGNIGGTFADPLTGGLVTTVVTTQPNVSYHAYNANQSGQPGTDQISLEVDDSTPDNGAATTKVLATGSTPITVAATSAILSPLNPISVAGAATTFTVAVTGALPQGVTYKWAVGGSAGGTLTNPANGSVGSGFQNTSTSAVYTASGSATSPQQDTVTVTVFAPNTATPPVQVALANASSVVSFNNPWVGSWVGNTVSTCGYYSGPQNFTITQINATTLNFGPYQATFSGNQASVNGGAVVFTLSGNTITGYEADSCQNGTYTRQ
jgi:hypothetical protein